MHVGFYAGGPTGGIDGAVAEVEAIVEVLEAAGDPSGLARAWRLLMGLHMALLGGIELGGEAAQRVIELATQAGDMRLVGTRRGQLLGLRALRPDHSRGSAVTCEKLVEAVADDRKAEAVVLSVLARPVCHGGRERSGAGGGCRRPGNVC